MVSFHSGLPTVCIISYNYDFPIIFFRSRRFIVSSMIGPDGERLATVASRADNVWSLYDFLF